jgi:two-component system response regulator MtrA
MVHVPPTAPQNGPARGRVLVVDDDAALAEMLGIVLRREGYEPAFVSDGNRAVGVFQQTRPDLVLLDLMLPGRNGLQICQDIRTQSTVPATTIVIAPIRTCSDERQDRTARTASRRDST